MNRARSRNTLPETVKRNSETPPERGLVARAGVEPATFHFSGERCYQLSYLAKTGTSPTGVPKGNNATPTGLEPATSAVTGRRANQLRYGALTGQPG
jgi:hypothetical protein